jgi:hypothetical protein
MEAMRRNWFVYQNDEKELRTRIIGLRLFYDWPALKSTVAICPARDSGGFKINDLWNVLDMHIALKFGFRAHRREERPSPMLVSSA